MDPSTDSYFRDAGSCPGGSAASGAPSQRVLSGTTPCSTPLIPGRSRGAAGPTAPGISSLGISSTAIDKPDSALVPAVYRRRPLTDAALSLDLQPDLKRHFMAMEARCAEELARTAELERAISAQRVEISRWSAHLLHERRVVIREVDAFRRPDSDKWHLFLELEQQIKDCGDSARLSDFLEPPFRGNEQAFCALVDEMRRKYPMYQIRPTRSAAEAVDTLVCTAEVCMEDAMLMQASIESAKRDAQELRAQIRQLEIEIEALEEGFMEVTPGGDVPPLASAADPYCGAHMRGPADENAHMVPRLAAASLHAPRNVLDLSLDSVKTRRYTSPSSSSSSSSLLLPLSSQ